MSGFDATPMELRACGSMLAQISDEVRAKITMLQSDMDALLASGWQGSAANGFGAGWNEWRHGAHAVLDALHDMGKMLDGIGARYQAADSGSAAGVTRSGVDL